jgi:hypothetical protein
VDDKRGFPETLLRRLYETVVVALPLDSAGKAARRLQKHRASENILYPPVLCPANFATQETSTRTRALWSYSRPSRIESSRLAIRSRIKAQRSISALSKSAARPSPDSSPDP